MESGCRQGTNPYVLLLGSWLPSLSVHFLCQKWVTLWLCIWDSLGPAKSTPYSMSATSGLSGRVHWFLTLGHLHTPDWWMLCAQSGIFWQFVIVGGTVSIWIWRAMALTARSWVSSTDTLDRKLIVHSHCCHPDLPGLSGVALEVGDCHDWLWWIGLVLYFLFTVFVHFLFYYVVVTSSLISDLHFLLLCAPTHFCHALMCLTCIQSFPHPFCI